jgi:hypothetical protein
VPPCDAGKQPSMRVRPPNNAFKLTSASRVEALRATTRGRRSQLNAMFDGLRDHPRGGK